MTQPPPVPPSPLPYASTAPSSGTTDAISTMIPYRNVPALIAYYLGVFSLIPCIGLALGGAAVVLGIIGLRRAGQNPEAKGKVHAWVGIILGGLCALANVLVVLLMILGPILAATHHRSFR